jgi:hypothetical protein
LEGYRKCKVSRKIFTFVKILQADAKLNAANSVINEVCGDILNLNKIRKS